MFRIYFRRSDRYARVRRIPGIGRLSRRGLVALPELPVHEFHRVLAGSPFTDLHGTRKDTFTARFQDLDPLVVRVLDEVAQSRTPLRVHDVGVSSGNTSLELLHALEEADLDIRLTVSDRFCRLWVQRGFVGSVYDPTERFVEGWVGPLAADPSDRLVTVPVTVLLGRLLRGLRPRRSSTAREVLLFVPELRRRIEAGLVRHADYDVLRPTLDRAYDFVRCMNVLNRVYFEPDSLRLGIAGLGRMLAEGGVLLLGRTEVDSGRHLASFYRRQDDELHLIEAVNGGTDVAEFVPCRLESSSLAS